MNTLNISDIFSQFSYYQEHYLSILSTPEQYYTAVEGAYIHVWPLAPQDLYLGDLLQLWFSEKWLIQSTCQLLSDHLDNGTKKPLQRDHDLYLYQLAGSALSGSNRSRVWSVSEQKQLRVELDSAFRYLCEYKATTQPVVSKSELIAALKNSI